MKYILFAIIFVTGGVSRAGEVTVIDLTADPGRLPYQTTTHYRFQVGNSTGQPMGARGVFFDVDDDGFRDFIRSNQYYISATGLKNGNAVTYYQTNLDPPYCREDADAFAFSPLMDLDGDGHAELVVTGHTADRFAWRFWVIDPRNGEILASFDLPGGDDLRPDGKWDGSYSVSGALACRTAGGPRTAVVINVNVGFDIAGRGAMAVDPWSGEILWRFRTGPNPLEHATQVLDLDGDGQQEVVLFGRAPDNLDGRKINNYSDNESRLFVLDSEGELVWTRRLGGWYGAGYLITADIENDGYTEIITSTFTTPEVWGEVVVWNHDGRRLAAFTSDNILQNIQLLGETGTVPARLAVAAQNQEVFILEYRPPQFRQVAVIKTDAMVFINGVADLLPERGNEMVLTTQAGTTWVLASDLEPLARYDGPPRGWHSTMTPWRPAKGLDLLMRMDYSHLPLVFTPAPGAADRTLPLAGTGVVVLAVGLFLVARRRYADGSASDPVILREVRLNLLEDLELSGHGAIAPLKSVRRLVWHLNALGSGLGDTQGIEVRLRETWTECREGALPHLAGILDRSRLAGLTPSHIDVAVQALRKIAVQLEHLEEIEFRGDRIEEIAADTQAATTRTEEALKDLRREVAAYFRTDLIRSVKRVLQANLMELEEHGIAVETGFLAYAAAGSGEFMAQAPTGPLHCLIDPQECAFVLDNLVGNAISAMKQSPHRSLRITWTVSDGMVHLDVRDTGCGIPEEDRDRILNTRFSTRAGGGAGLPTTRRILRKYGGGLTLLQSQVDGGSTFRMTLPSSRS